MIAVAEENAKRRKDKIWANYVEEAPKDSSEDHDDSKSKDDQGKLIVGLIY